MSEILLNEQALNEARDIKSASTGDAEIVLFGIGQQI